MIDLVTVVTHFPPAQPGRGEIMQAHQVQPSWVSMAITLGLVLIVMALRMRGMSKMRAA